MRSSRSPGIDRTTIKPDWDVYASDGAHIGTVGEVGEDYILVQRGLVFVHDLFIPISAIERVEDEAVYLQVSRQDVFVVFASSGAPPGWRT